MGTWNTRGLRGSTLEDFINHTNDSYREKHLALIQKIPTPITPIEIDKASRHITLAYFDQKSTVDYIGANDDHGLYLQIDHGNGIKSFYAHCSKLCVSQGQVVAAGEKVAEVGSTGVSTGPHLHLELKWNGLHLNPAYYVEFLTG